MVQRIAGARLAFWLVIVFGCGSSSLAQEKLGAERTVIAKTTPAYPDIARRLQLTGTVKVEVLVRADGHVKSTRVIGGSPLLAQTAAEAIQKWKWEPAPAESKELVELHFHPR